MEKEQEREPQPPSPPPPPENDRQNFSGEPEIEHGSEGTNVKQA